MFAKFSLCTVSADHVGQIKNLVCLESACSTNCCICEKCSLEYHKNHSFVDAKQVFIQMFDQLYHVNSLMRKLSDSRKSKDLKRKLSEVKHLEFGTAITETETQKIIELGKSLIEIDYSSKKGFREEWNMKKIRRVFLSKPSKNKMMQLENNNNDNTILLNQVNHTLPTPLKCHLLYKCQNIEKRDITFEIEINRKLFQRKAFMNTRTRTEFSEYEAKIAQTLPWGSTPSCLVEQAHLGQISNIIPLSKSGGAYNIATLANDGFLKIWSSGKLKCEATLKLQLNKQEIMDMEYIPDLNSLAVAGLNRILLISISNLKVIRQFIVDKCDNLGYFKPYCFLLCASEVNQSVNTINLRTGESKGVTNINGQPENFRQFNQLTATCTYTLFDKHYLLTADSIGRVGQYYLTEEGIGNNLLKTTTLEDGVFSMDAISSKQIALMNCCSTNSSSLVILRIPDFFQLAVINICQQVHSMGFYMDTLLYFLKDGQIIEFKLKSNLSIKLSKNLLQGFKPSYSSINESDNNNVLPHQRRKKDIFNQCISIDPNTKDIVCSQYLTKMKSSQLFILRSKN